LKVLLGVGVLAVIGGGAGTFASFTAETTNAGNTFATGTLLLDNTSGGTTCHSSSDAVDNAITSGCKILFSVDPLPSAASATYAELTLSNVGTLDASGIDFSASSPACTTGKSDPAGPVFGGGGNLCSALQVVVIETDAAFHHDSANPALGCAYGTVDPNNATTGAGCVFAPSVSLDGLPTSFTPLTLKSDASGNTGGQLTHGQSRHFLIGVSTPAASGLNNTFQNRNATFDLTWRITQA
jgi:predicted ribosomally synthesized peptide with SipW-like signal peptide